MVCSLQNGFPGSSPERASRHLFRSGYSFRRSNRKRKQTTVPSRGTGFLPQHWGHQHTPQPQSQCKHVAGEVVFNYAQPFFKWQEVQLTHDLMWLHKIDDICDRHAFIFQIKPPFSDVPCRSVPTSQKNPIPSLAHQCRLSHVCVEIAVAPLNKTIGILELRHANSKMANLRMP